MIIISISNIIKIKMYIIGCGGGCNTVILIFNNLIIVEEKFKIITIYFQQQL